MKWIFSVLAFILIAACISASTTYVFINNVNSGFDKAKSDLAEKSANFTEEGLKITYAQMTPEQLASLNNLKTLTVDEKKSILSTQCTEIRLKDQPFCDSRFISGNLTLDDVLKENIKLQFENASLTALSESRSKLDVFQKYPLVLISIISAILSLIFYVLGSNILLGIQKFFANASWLAIFSAVSFKIMPALVDKLTANLQDGLPPGAENIAATMKQIIIDWLGLAMDKAFIFSITLAVIAGLVWFGIKFFRKYRITAEY